MGKTKDMKLKFASTTGSRAEASRCSICIFFGPLLFISLITMPDPAQAQFSRLDEEQKAAYLRKIIGFVEWQNQPASTSEGGFQFCVDGDAILGFALSVELRGITVHSQKVNVRLIDKEQQLKGCQALVIASYEKKHIARDLEAIEGAGVLTFGQSNQFLEEGGAVQLIQDGTGMHFAVNLAATRKAGVKLDARLLLLAKRILREDAPAGG
jgi:hypothetical protein